MLRRHLLLATAGAMTAPLAAPRLASAQSGPWPNRPVRIINPYSPGGASDLILRPVLDRLERAFGKPFIIENRVGAGGTIGVAAGAQERPDGHALLLANTGPLTIAPSLFPSLPYDPTKAFSWVAMLAGAPIVCAVKGDGPYRTLADFTAKAKSGREAVTYGSSGTGSLGHLVGVQYGLEIGATLLHVPFRGAPEAQQGVLGGNTDALWDTVGANAAAIRAGNLRGLAISSTTRMTATPDVPTVTELGLPNVAATNWFLLAAPAGLDPEIGAKLRQVLEETYADATLRERLGASGIAPMGGMTPAQIGAYVAQEEARWGRVVRTAGVKPG